MKAKKLKMKQIILDWYSSYYYTAYITVLISLNEIFEKLQDYIDSIYFIIEGGLYEHQSR